MTSRANIGQLLACCWLLTQVAGLQAQILSNATQAAPAESAAPGNVQQAQAALTEDSAATGVRQVVWPKITMPQMTLPKIKLPQVTMPKWTMPDMSKLWNPVAAGFKKISAGSKKVWEGSKQMFSFGKKDAKSAPAAPVKSEPSLLRRMLGEAPEPAGPQTVGEWMSQPRLDP